MRITAACPEALVADANNYAMCLAYSLADGLTYNGLNWVDPDGNLYAAASWEARDEWVDFVSPDTLFFEFGKKSIKRLPSHTSSNFIRIQVGGKDTVMHLSDTMMNHINPKSVINKH